uniref:Phosphate-binding protein n=1 Tax=Ignisphaera aggregans TaxID=334771 RepID=A0A7C2ZP40_9CREN
MKISTVVVIVIVAVIAFALAYYAYAYYMRQGGASELPASNKGVILQGAGASFVYPQIVEWASRFQNRYGIQINYQSVGSGAGQSMFFQKVVDFACSDPPLSKETWSKYNGSVLQIPWLFGAVVIVYNIPELPNNTVLKLDAVAIARIYRGDIVYWDDEYIKNLNPDLASMLPHKEIIVVYRSDSSGTTQLFTTFLYKASGGVWPRELVGKSISWPVEASGRGVGGKGNEGVTQIVIQTPYSIGYVEWSYAIKNNLSIAAIKNAADNFILPSKESLQAALENAEIPASPLDDFSGILDSIIYAPGKDGYPIAGPTHIILWREYEDPNKAEAIKLFLRWIAEEGYDYVLEGYVAPPESVRELLIEAADLVVS